MNGGIMGLEMLGQAYHMVLWPLLRTTSFVAIAPILGGRGVPNRIRLTVAMGLTLLLVAVLPAPPELEVFSANWWLTALQQVDPLRHQIIVQHFFEGHTVEAIAVKLKLAKSTVSTKKTIALGWLRTYIQSQG